MKKIKERNDEQFLGIMLKEARQRKNLTLKELSMNPEISISMNFLSRVERGEALPSDELLLKLAKNLDLDIENAMLELFREKASDKVRAYLPPTSFLTLRDKLGEIEHWNMEERSTLAEISEPLGKVVKSYKRLKEELDRGNKENQDLQNEIVHLKGLLKEKHKSLVPSINIFYNQLFNYSIDTVKKDVIMHEDGKASISTTMYGIAPSVAGNPIRTLSHNIYIPSSQGGISGMTGKLESFSIASKPANLKIDYSFHLESKEKAVLNIVFPEGFSYKPRQGELSYSFSYQLDKAFLMTLEEAMVAYGQKTVHDMILEWSSCFVKRPTRKLITSVLFPAGYNPMYIDRWVWLTEVSFLESEENLAPRLLLGETDGIVVSNQGNRLLASLSVENPLLGFSYGIVWQPLSRMRKSI